MTEPKVKMMRQTSVLLLTLTLILGSAVGHTQELDLRELLQRMEREFDRESLDPDIEFSDQQGIRWATRDVGDLERALIDQAIVEHRQRYGTERRSGSTTVPVVFHVVRRSNGSWNLSDRKIDRQIEVLNTAYARTGYRFRLQSIRRHTNDKFARKCLNVRVERQFKQRHAVDPRHTLNVYTCRPAQGVLGYAYFPSDYSEASSMHGVVLLHSTLPGGRAAPYNRGHTLTHEVGHYLGLMHTFQGRCGTAGDRVDDTAAERTPNYGCPKRRDTCPNRPGNDPIHNFMDYSTAACMNQFTPGQGSRMNDQITVFRPSLGG